MRKRGTFNNGNSAYDLFAESGATITLFGTFSQYGGGLLTFHCDVTGGSNSCHPYLASAAPEPPQVGMLALMRLARAARPPT